MLVNGQLLGVKLPGGTEFKDLPDLKTVPDMNNEKEKVENTPLSSANKRYENGVGDYGDMEYTFVHSENKEGTAYRMLRQYADSDTPLEFMETWTDGTTFTYTAIPSLGFKRGGGTNTVVDLSVKMSLQSDIVVGDPT
ncbi:MAG: phage tail protein [Lachnospiraceae bacterium]|nr:phage tail protein [Lachnospiraceae bacterium]